MARFEEKDFSQDNFNLKVWKRIFQLFAPFYKQLIILLVLVIMTALGDVIMPLLNQISIDKFASGDFNNSELYLFIAIYILIIFAVSIINYFYFKAAGKVEMGFGYHLRELCFRKLNDLSFSFYDTTPTGWLMARITSDISRLAEIIAWSFMDMAWGIPVMFMSMFIMLRSNVMLTLVVLIVVPILAVMSVVMQKKLLKAYRGVRKANSKITNSFSEGINGAKTTKTLSLEQQNFEDFKKDTSEMRHVSIEAAVVGAKFRPLVNFISSFTLALLIWVGGDLAKYGVISFGTLMMFIQYAQQFYEPIRVIAYTMSEFQLAQASGERVVYLIDSEVKITDTPEVIAKYGTVFAPKEENYEDIKGDISFKHVDFHYIEEEPILRDFNLDIKAGQTIALVGETGSGKSTIVNLICRFYEPVKGEILIDGVDYRKRSIAWLHSKLGYVLQAPHLFSGTIMDNVRFGRLDATDEEVYEACKLVNAHDFIMRFDKGYLTDVGEGGSRLSTGQKQLISFARAVLANPRIFILDEATASIDTETEKIIQYAIENIMKGKTSFVVAHRLSTIVNADRILVIKKGQIVEDGTHIELMKKKAYYYELYTNQFKEDLAKGLIDENIDLSLI